MLLLQQIPIPAHSYCVDGFIVQHQASDGTVIRRRIEVVPSYSFEWNQELHTVTVEAYNSLGSSTNNFNMTLDSQPKREWSLDCWINEVPHCHYYFSTATPVLGQK